MAVLLRPWSLLRVAAVAGLVFSSVTAEARVFDRWRAGSQSTRTLEALGGRVAYETEVRSNGGAGRMTVLRFDRGPDAVAADIERAFAVRWPEGGDAAARLVTVRDSGQVIRLLLAPAADPGRAVLFQYAQSEAQFRESGQAPPPAPVAGIPAFPGATAVSSLRNEGTGTTLAVWDADAAPAAVQEFYAGTLRAAGWRAATPGRDDAGLAVFVRGPEICCVGVSAGRAGGPCRISLLHRRQGLK
jgi:hypothetical protein